MRLLNTTTGELVWLSDHEMRDTRYAILSHVWGESEQSYQDVSAIPPLPPATPAHDVPNDPLFPAVSIRLNPKLSPKIRGACIYAFLLGFKWIWIDTCCIDKTSSAELSEAINSMFNWYARATMCIVYLEDVRDPPDTPHGFSLDDSLPLQSDLTESRWFTRGWTLQELVAPRVVEFVSRGWRLLGTKAGMAMRLERRTRIDAAVLRSDRALSAVCVADRMQWAAGRQTTRVEDRAYSLLGIFGVNLPTLYGEGDAAFQRLQEAIIASSSDATLFMWNRQPHKNGLLASVPEDYLKAQSLSIMSVEEIPVSVDAFLGTLNSRTPSTQKSSGQLSPDTPSFTKTSYGVRAWIPLIRCANHPKNAIAVMAVKCQGQYQGLALEHYSTTETLHHYTVERAIAPSTLPECWTVWDRDTYFAEWVDIYVTDAPPFDLLCETIFLQCMDGSRRLNVPTWVLSRMSHHYGFSLLDYNFTRRPVPINDLKIADDMGCLFSRTFTFTSVDPHSRDVETLQMEFSKTKPAQGGVALLCFYICGVTLNGRKADPFPGPASAEHSDGMLWFGDENRAVGFTPLSGQNDDDTELDIRLSGRVYERYQQIYGARWRAPSLAVDDSVQSPSSPSTPGTSPPTAADLSEVRRMINDAMAPLQAELASARAELARVVPRLAAAEKVARLAAAEKVARLKKARTFRRRV